MNKKGVTLVEMIVSMTILLVVATFLFQMIISLKEIYNSSGVKTELFSKQAVIYKMINDDFMNKGIELITRCSDSENCLSIYYKDGTNKKLEFKKKNGEEKAYFMYGDYKTYLIDNSDFGNYKIETTTVLDTTNKNDSILKIDVPIIHPLFKNEQFGINVIYEYNSNKTSITDLSITGNNGASSIWLSGASDMIWYTTVDYEEPGFYYLDSNNNLIKATESTEDVSVTRSDIVDNKMTITYQSLSDSTKKATRTVQFINTSYNYEVNKSYYTFNAPVDGIYKIETWGADGNGSASNPGGQGSYVSGTISLNANEKLYVYVGSTGTNDEGGYNGGGSLTANQSQTGGYAGGGATDIRLENGQWNLTSSLNSRIMVAAGGGGSTSSNCGSNLKKGGNGGTQTSSSFAVSGVCTDGLWTIGKGATASQGGLLEIYDISGSHINTLVGGKFGYADAPEDFEGDIKSGGGSGYFGGTSSGHGSPATGGSSFASGCIGCKAVDKNGNLTDSNIHYSGKVFNNVIMEENKNNPINSNNGYAKITLISTSYSS